MTTDWRFLRIWLCRIVALGVVAGTACALFLWLLEEATEARFRHPQLVWGLPFAGGLVAWIYSHWGGNANGGNRLIFEEILEPRQGVPRRMAPLVLLGTIVTHLCGGSAGREGTAVQMGGSLASALAKWFPTLSPREWSCWITVGVAAGFGGVFGTPLAGAIFSIEALPQIKRRSHFFVAAFLGAIISDRVCLAWGIHHTKYQIAKLDIHFANATTNGYLLGQVILAALVFGACSRLFVATTYYTAEVFRRMDRRPWARSVVGGGIVLVLMQLLSSRDYLGLGVTSPDEHAVTISRCFQSGGAEPLSWLWKMIFTLVTVGSGFKGGEVTPLFFIGAALGNAVSSLCNGPVDLLAGLGMIAVFSGASKTPWSCTALGCELFGYEHSVYFFIACHIANFVSGNRSLYLTPEPRMQVA